MQKLTERLGNFVNSKLIKSGKAPVNWNYFNQAWESRSNKTNKYKEKILKWK